MIKRRSNAERMGPVMRARKSASFTCALRVLQTEDVVAYKHVILRRMWSDKYHIFRSGVMRKWWRELLQPYLKHSRDLNLANNHG